MIIKRVINTVPLLSVLNSVYLSYIYLEAFMLGKLTNELESNFALILFTTLFIITMVITIGHLRNKSKNNLKKTIPYFRDYFIERILPFIFAIFFSLYIYDSLKSNYNKLLLESISILIEILSISFAIGKQRENAILKLCGFVAFWVCVGTICFSITGFFAEYLGYEILDDSNIKLIFTGIFYHLLNACFLFYSFLPKNLTQWDFKKENLSRKKNTKILDLQ